MFARHKSEASRLEGNGHAKYTGGDAVFQKDRISLRSKRTTDGEHKILPSLMSLVGVGNKHYREGKGRSSERGSRNKKSILQSGMSSSGPNECGGKAGKGKVKSKVKNVFVHGCGGKGFAKSDSSYSKTSGTASPTPCKSLSGKGKGKGSSDKSFDDIGCHDTSTPAPSTLLPTQQPSSTPSLLPTILPSSLPSKKPSISPTYMPTEIPSHSPSINPTALPSPVPSTPPTILPTSTPSDLPTPSPSEQPSISHVPTLPLIAVAVAPFRLEFEGVANATTADFDELEEFVLGLLDDLYSDLFAGQTNTDYSGIQGGASSSADSHIDFDFDFVFTGSSSNIPDVDTLDLLLEDVLLSPLFLDSLTDLSASNPFSEATSVQIV